MENDAPPSSCNINKTYLPIKIAYFTLFAGMASLWNFISLHMKSLGLTPTEIGIIRGVPPFVGALSPIIFGCIADRYRIHSQLCGTLAVVTACIQVLLFFTPSAIPHQTKTTNTSNVPCANVTSFPINVTFPNLTSSQDGINTPLCTLLCCDTPTVFCQDLNGDLVASTEARTDCSFVANASKWETMCVDNPKSHIITTCLSLSLVTRINSTNIFHLVNFCDAEEKTPPATLSCSVASQKEVVIEKFGLTFRVYFSIYFVAVAFAMNSIWPLINAITYARLGNERNRWGRQRAWGTIGDGVITLPTSFAMHFLGSGKQPSFIPNFVMHFVLVCTAGFIICCLKGKVKVLERRSMWKDFRNVMKIWETYVLLMLGFAFGTFQSAFDTLLPLYIVDFPDGNERVVAMSAIFTILGEVPCLFFARNVIDRLGYVRCLYLACSADILRFFLYSIAPGAWWVLPVNLLNGLTYGIMYTSLTAYASSLTPPALHGTMQSMISTLTWNLGHGFGGVMSGELMDRIGTRTTCTLFSASAGIILVLYFAYVNILFHACSWRKSRERRQQNGAVELMATPSGDDREQLLAPSADEDENSDSLEDERDEEGSFEQFINNT